MNKNKGTLYLIPTLLGDTPIERVIPSYNIEIVRELSVFVVEELKTARHFLKKSGYPRPFDSSQFFVLNEHTSQEEIAEMIVPLLSGSNVGLLSEAGLPCVADPGASFVNLCHQEKIHIVPLSGPSSIFMALMASGFNGQQFAFHGYLPIEMRDKVKKIREMESVVFRNGQTQIFIEAPYRNRKLLQLLAETCHPDTLICVACLISTAEESIRTLRAWEWKKQIPEIDKKPVVFLIGQ
ncbi:MAG: SAM-dependent methyltransferase [Bacteroidota bacterium]|nr:SAM-dependent methyltransferase [Bacteroidota bacterium]